MYQHPYMTTAVAEQRRADLMAAAQHARDVRLAKAARNRLRLRPAQRHAGSPVATTSAPALAN